MECVLPCGGNARKEYPFRRRKHTEKGTPWNGRRAASGQQERLPEAWMKMPGNGVGRKTARDASRTSG